jgi:hypothetical protein
MHIGKYNIGSNHIRCVLLRVAKKEEPQFCRSYSVSPSKIHRVLNNYRELILLLHKKVVANYYTLILDLQGSKPRSCISEDQYQDLKIWVVLCEFQIFRPATQLHLNL